MKLEMICTGEEVLSGQIVDTNAAWFANLMMEEGIELERRVTVGDRLEDLADVFVERSHHADVILVNGGLGPTKDDMSAEAMAKAKGEPLQECSEWRERLESWYSAAGREMPASNLKQAMLPASAIMVDNPVGTACGFRVKLNRAWLYFTPGVPNEFKQMVQDQFISFVKEEYGLNQTTELTKLLTFGRGESSLADQLDALELPEGITIGYRSSMPHIEIKLFARGESATQALPAFTELVKGELGSSLVSERFPTLAEEMHHRLLEAGKTLSLAESCTGGLIASNLVEFPGSSGYLQQALVTYCNESKVKLLGVKPDTLEAHGAVSVETVMEMAEGVRGLLDSDFALATSGVAGPDGGTEEKPVGTVAFALATREKTFGQVLHIPLRTRSMIRVISGAVALDMLRLVMGGESPISEYAFIQRSVVRD